MIGRLFAAAAVAALFISAAPVAEADSLPPGSYKQTCQNATLDGETLKADCKTFSGSMNHTELPFATSCVGIISNINGVLACSAPTGSFARTCNNAVVKNHQLTASCEKVDGSWMTSTTSFSGFQHPVTNCNGQLVDRPNC